MLLDDHVIYAECLAKALNEEPDMEVVHMLKSVDCLSYYLKTADIIITEIKVDNQSLIPYICQLAESHPDKHFIILTAFYEQPYRWCKCIEHIQAIVSKGTSLEQLKDQIRKVFYLNRRLCPPAIEKNILSVREHEILQLIAKDMTNKEISERLFISRRTVDYQISSLIRKLEVESRVGAVIKGMKLGLLEHSEV